MLKNVSVQAAKKHELADAQRFYDSRGYGGTPIETSDFVVLARHDGELVGIGRLSRETQFICLRGMQVQPDFQNNGIGSRILEVLVSALGTEDCYCLPYKHLVNFYGQAGFRDFSAELPTVLDERLATYLDRGLAESASRPRSCVIV